jgi:hypothetical protein
LLISIRWNHFVFFLFLSVLVFFLVSTFAYIARMIPLQESSRHFFSVVDLRNTPLGHAWELQT